MSAIFKLIVTELELMPKIIKYTNSNKPQLAEKAADTVLRMIDNDASVLLKNDTIKTIFKAVKKYKYNIHICLRVLNIELRLKR